MNYILNSSGGQQVKILIFERCGFGVYINILVFNQDIKIAFLWKHCKSTLVTLRTRNNYAFKDYIMHQAVQMVCRKADPGIDVGLFWIIC